MSGLIDGLHGLDFAAQHPAENVGGLDARVLSCRGAGSVCRKTSTLAHLDNRRRGVAVEVVGQHDGEGLAGTWPRRTADELFVALRVGLGVHGAVEGDQDGVEGLHLLEAFDEALGQLSKAALLTAPRGMEWE
jgi:hypothetical protein